MLRYIAGPLIGSLIGYSTNYIAVKMLFYPKKEIRILGHKLPFTPGAIPKGKPRLAKAIGDIVGITLLTKEDIESKLLSEEMENRIAEAVTGKCSLSIKAGIMEVTEASEDSYKAGREKLAQLLSQELCDALSKVELADIITEKGGEAIKEKVKGTMFAMFLTDELIQSVIGPIGLELQSMIAEQGITYIKPLVEEKLESMEQESGLSLLETMDMTQDKIKAIVVSLYEKLIHSGMSLLLDELNISELVEEKIINMDINELENLVLTVMKKELDTIVNLGAFIGFLLGVLNIFIAF